jgi:phosphatidylserine decarboxylase
MKNGLRQEPSGWRDYVRAWPQYLLPHYFLSGLMHRATRCRWRWWKNLLIKAVVRHYRIDMTAAVQSDALAYPSFNKFFTRAYRPAARPLSEDPQAVACPVDGSISQIGRIENTTLLQAKGRDYRLDELLADDAAWIECFRGGSFATLYLAPRDYHRIHNPLDGILRQTTHVPGRLFSVNPATVRTIPRLFARNERVIAYFNTKAGPMAVIMVGAIFVASIETVWFGEITPPRRRSVQRWRHDREEQAQRRFARGAEIGRFNMGSTVILLFGRDRVRWVENLQNGSTVQMGQTIGSWLPGVKSGPHNLS